MPKFISIGEALIDFMPDMPGRLANISNFTKCPGGAPANAAAAVAKLGISSMVITKLGSDAFGDFLEGAMKSAGIDTKAVLRTSKAKTALAFVSHTEDGERDFMFYRSPSADMLLEPDDIDPRWFESGDVLHFCSVDLVDAPCRKAHDRAIEIAREKGCLISFDVNLRFPLWDSEEDLKRTVLSYIPKADIVKVSDDELVFLGEFDSPYRVTTMGKTGARYKGGEIDVFVPGFDTPAVDTTGAGDAFIGSFLTNVIKTGGLPGDAEAAMDMLRFSHAAASIVVERYGALGVMPSVDEVNRFMRDTKHCLKPKETERCVVLRKTRMSDS